MPKTGELKGRLVLDDRQRTETVKPLQPRELVADDTTNTVYITGIGKESVIWVVDGETLKLKDTITNTGTYSTGLALDPQAKTFVYHQRRRRTGNDRHRHSQGVEP
ncbi:Uncharacterised protein [Lelliottia amnigena]|nr:Uncharacterised protein [Lelliottia amnigena]